MTVGHLFAAGALALLCACAPAGPQWTVLVSTNAPLPTFGDRLLVEVLEDDGAPACTGCRRDFGLDPQTQWPLSFGVLRPASGKRIHVRARLYRADHVGSDGLPLADGDGVIDALGVLPATSGDTRVALELRGDCFEKVSDVSAHTTCGGPETILSLATPDQLPLPGTWPVSPPAPCQSEPRGDMKCIPGGVFLCGSVNAPPFDAIYDASFPTTATPERAVRVDTFLIDTDEMTVGDLRRLVHGGQVTLVADAAAMAASAIVEPDNQKAGADAGVDPACTWLGVDSDANDSLPLNCISWASANALCQARDGGHLPTEAQWEYAAGNTQRETTYPWGESPNVQDVCLHAFVGRGRGDGVSRSENPVCFGFDAGASASAGPVARSTETLDVTDRGVRNMGGNVQEYVADNYEAYTDFCWTAAGPLLQNPSCDAGGAQSPRSVRGGGWQGSPDLANVSERNLVPAHYRGDAFTGLRCAVDLPR